MEDVSKELVFSDGMFTLIKKTMIRYDGHQFVDFQISCIDEIDRYKVSVIIINENSNTTPNYRIVVCHERDKFFSFRETAEYISIIEKALQFAMRVKKYMIEYGYMVIE